jgi:hypothetical protein
MLELQIPTAHWSAIALDLLDMNPSAHEGRKMKKTAIRHTSLLVPRIQAGRLCALDEGKVEDPVTYRSNIEIFCLQRPVLAFRQCVDWFQDIVWWATHSLLSYLRIHLVE